MIKSNEIDKMFDALQNAKSLNVGVSDISISPLLASNIKPPFIYVSGSKEGVMHATEVLKNCGRITHAVAVSPEPPLYSTNTTPDPLAVGVQRFQAGEVDVLVLYAPLLRQLLPKINATPLALQVGQTLPQRTLLKFLEDCGYERVTTPTAQNQYSSRGDVVDLWYENIVVRVMFFGDVIEAIQGRKTLTIIPPTAGATVSPSQARGVIEQVKPTHENTKKIISQISTSFEKDARVAGGRWMAPFLYEMAPVAQILNHSQFVLEQPPHIYESLVEYEKSDAIKFQSLQDGGLLLPQHVPSTGGRLPPLQGICFATGGGDISLLTLPVPNFYNAFSTMVPDILRCHNAGKTVIVFMGTTPALANYMLEKKIKFEFATTDNVHEGKINLIKGSFGLNFELPSEKIVIYSVSPQPTNYDEARTVSKTTEFTLPNIGEVIVHEFHGLGRFIGSQQMDMGLGVREYLTLQYDGGALVYVPADQTNMLSNYVGEPTRLNRIGGKDFTAVKQRLRRKLTELSHKLVKLYAKRNRAKATKYEIDPKLIEEYVASFPHNYTPDQKSALADIMADMDSDKVVDRLVCGDVGVGKTEVALAAAFRAVMCGFQVALLCPTTILSEQHYQTVKSRLGAFGARVAVLNRFKSDKEVTVILGALERGEIDVLVGTHRLLSPDVRFKNLSMLILDEEQRFGVTHKEKIKELKTNVDVLTLTATPIPRTLHMALLGIRDISTINTKPVDRQGILTYVTEFSNELLTEAISRELHRGGQTLVLYNRVETIENFAAKISIGRVAIAHGQMSSAQLADVIKKLYAREIDVLVCSTIIENGIDIATANTLVVIDADKLGVAQMHQIRGRVGRSDKQAYAYLTYAKGKVLSTDARERLDAIRQHGGAGAGYNIAMRDLQLRGAGDILGENQSGHLSQVGIEIYTRILTEVAKDTQRHSPNTD